ncbi:hypothetical protein [Actinomadura rupiterrae]|uniref:hypothetical protein n=1 Tax=Actinomadura rupiterrae TaxID=559627 RepID=UPI0020A23956|nr:hypothetical protein [Actinomadura rupiterrae]MCP2343380.1 hypothetical protein [Actinomadura rupiterrae]
MIEIRANAEAEPARADAGHNPDQTLAIADALAESARLLTYATMPGSGGLDDPGDVYTVLGSLTAAIGSLPQTLAQMSELVRDQIAQGRAVENPFYGPNSGNANASYAEMHAAIQQAGGHLAALLRDLQAAHIAVSGLGINPNPPSETNE